MISISLRSIRLVLIIIALCALSGPFVSRLATVATTLGNVKNAAELAGNGTPASGGPLVITAQPEQFEPTPRGEQVLRLAGSPLGVESLDPATAQDISTTFLVRQIFRGLVKFDKNLQLV